MANKLIIANHKMNMDAKDIKNYLEIVKDINDKNVIICPTSIYIPYFLKKNFRVGIQNTFIHKSGSFTGEISPSQARSLGVEYTIIGHSERRTYLDESDTLINKKVLEALDNHLQVILCIGETLEEKNMLKTDKVLKRQIINDLKDVVNIDHVLIAYEPVWAIGSGMVAKNKDIKATITYIKSIVDNLYKDNHVKVLYGGSINAKNIRELKKIKEVDGFLIGGASINAESLLKIIEVVGNQ